MQLAALLDPRSAPRRRRARCADKWRQMRAAWALERAWTKDADPRSVSEPGHLSRRAAGHRRGGRGAVRQGAARPDPTRSRCVLAALVRAPNAERAALTRRARRAGALDGAAANGSGAALGRTPSPEPSTGRAVVATRPRLPPPSTASSTHRGAARARRAGAARRAPPAAAAGGPAPTRASTLDADTQRIAADVAAAPSARHPRPLGARRRRAGGRQRQRRRARLRRRQRRPLERAPRRRHPGAPPGRLDAQAVPLRAARSTAACSPPPRCSTTRRSRSPPATGSSGRATTTSTSAAWCSLRTALAGSLNVPAVRALLLVGADAFADQLRAPRLRRRRQPGDYYGPALALGSRRRHAVGAGQRLSRARQRRRVRHAAAPAPSRRRAGRPPRRAVYSADAAFIVADILADRDSRSVTFGLESPLATPLLERGEDRHQQGHARQLVRRLSRAATPSASGSATSPASRCTTSAASPARRRSGRTS